MESPAQGVLRYFDPGYPCFLRWAGIKKDLFTYRLRSISSCIIIWNIRKFSDSLQAL